MKRCLNAKIGDFLFLMYQKDEEYKELYKEAKTEYDQLLINEQSKTFNRKIRQSENKSKTVWPLCNQVAGKTNSNREFTMQGKPELLANELNEYLSNITAEFKTFSHPTCATFLKIHKVFFHALTIKKILAPKGQYQK